MQKLLMVFGMLMLLYTNICCQSPDKIYLLVRADDIGFTHAANKACIESYTNGIARSVEIMVPAPWFEEAVLMLKDHPGYDVGIHLVLTSEWTHLKWRPLSHAPSLIDDDGYFHPFIWPNKVEGATFFRDNDWKLEEVEREFRAQIELGLKKIPYASHLSYHMGSNNADPAINEMVKKLAKEYRLDIDPDDFGVKRAPGFGGSKTTFEEKEANFISMLDGLEPGIYMFVDHPGYDTPEMQSVSHVGYGHVAADREGVTKAFTSSKIKKAIEDKGIILISYKDLPTLK
ncbi:MAG: polysaccharide deacetylase family protein [Cyclobacteriaceae bacterium]